MARTTTRSTGKQDDEKQQDVPDSPAADENTGAQDAPKVSEQQVMQAVEQDEKQQDHADENTGASDEAENSTPEQDPADAFRAAWQHALDERDTATGAMPATAEDGVRVAFGSLPKGNIRQTLPATLQAETMATATEDPAKPDVSLMLAASRLVSLCAESAAKRAASSKPAADPLDVAAEQVAVLTLAALIVSTDLDREQVAKRAAVLLDVSDDDAVGSLSYMLDVLAGMSSPDVTAEGFDPSRLALLTRAEKLSKGRAAGGSRATSGGGGERGDVMTSIRDHAATLEDGVTLTVSELHALGIGASTGSVQHALAHAGDRLNSDGVIVQTGEVAKGRGGKLVQGIRVERTAA